MISLLQPTFRTLLVGKSGRKVASGDRTILIYLIVVAIILFIAALVWFLSTPRMIKDDSVPLITQSTTRHHKPTPDQTSLPTFAYWPPSEGYSFGTVQPTYFTQALPPRTVAHRSTACINLLSFLSVTKEWRCRFSTN
jgi:hypothetical protein